MAGEVEVNCLHEERTGVAYLKALLLNSGLFARKDIVTASLVRGQLPIAQAAELHLRATQGFCLGISNAVLHALGNFGHSRYRR